VEILISTHQLSWIGGTQTYILTIGEHLEQLGHEVTIYAPELGDAAALARERGLRVVSEDELPRRADVVYAQDGITPYELGERYPQTPFVCALWSKENPFWVAPQLPGMVAAVMAPNERAKRRAETFANAPEIVRLHQPVDLHRFAPRGPLRRERPRVLMLGNYVTGARRELVFRACEDVGYECRQVGYKSDTVTPAPEQVLNDADIVLGKARVIVEAMACARAAYVYDQNGGDGWVTPAKYPALEADNFSGRAFPELVDFERLKRDLLEYRPEMGPVNRDLAAANHNATRHAEALVELFRRLAPRSVSATTAESELARLMRVQWAATARATTAAGEAQAARDRLEEVGVENEAMRARLLEALAATEQRATAAEARAEAAEGRAEAAEARSRAAWERELELRSMRRFRLATALAAPLSAARSLARRNGR
jgi:hypothetical protein